MKGICKRVISLEQVSSASDGSPIYHLDLELTQPVEETDLDQVVINPLLTLHNVWVAKMSEDSLHYRFSFAEGERHAATAQATTLDIVAAMQYAQRAEVSVSEVVTAMRQNIRAAVPEDITAEVTLEGTVIRVKLADGIHNLPLRSVYLQHLLNGPMRFTWKENDDGGLRMHFNMPPEAELTEWFTQHNLVLRDAIKDIPEVAACCLALTSEKSRDLSYGYIVVMMNGGMMVTPMNIGQILCMVASGRQPEVEALFGTEGLNLTVHNDDLLPQALPYLEQISDEQLALTASL